MSPLTRKFMRIYLGINHLSKLHRYIFLFGKKKRCKHNFPILTPFSEVGTRVIKHHSQLFSPVPVSLLYIGAHSFGSSTTLHSIVHCPVPYLINSIKDGVLQLATPSCLHEKEPLWSGSFLLVSYYYYEEPRFHMMVIRLITSSAIFILYMLFLRIESYNNFQMED